MKDFEYTAPTTVREAVKLLAEKVETPEQFQVEFPLVAAGRR